MKKQNFLTKKITKKITKKNFITKKITKKILKKNVENHQKNVTF